MYDLKQIDATLKYGPFDGKKRKYFIIVFVSLTTLLLAGMITALYFLISEQVKGINPLPSTNFVFAIIGIGFGVSLIIVLALSFLIKNERARNEILLWLEDAVELEAYCKQSGESSDPEHELTLSPASIKIQIHFKYNGKKFSVDSGLEKPREGYLNYWKKYANKSVSILYSPKYNQVMILKQEK